ncbi:carboxymuconolactone decarboxylase family protein [Streptomyces sp. BR1]|uniref:carboxymuconolactone decarboxylase family protein n=1 Tax=Streptomyces sp. BR1 TaxID=1592323 RepID=UPI00402BDB1D
MEARMQNPAMVLPDAMQAIQGLYKATYAGGVPAGLLALSHLRASQINGCSPCVESASGQARKAGESDEKIFSVGAWRETPFYTDSERAALALTEHVTRLADREDPVPDAVWNEAAKHFNEQELAALVLHIAVSNLFNRLNATTKQQAGQKW